MVDDIITPKQRMIRQKRNRKRKEARKLWAERQAMPPVQGLRRSEFIKLFGDDQNYDAYADALIEAAKKARRRWEFI